MFVKDIMQKEVHKMDSGTSVKEAANLMSSEKVGYVLVMEGSRMVGIVTEDDIIKKIVVEDRSPTQTTLADIMVKDVIDIHPEKSLEDAAQVMTDKNIKKLPVLKDEELIGMLTAADMIAAEPKMMEHLGELVLFAKKPQRIAG